MIWPICLGMSAQEFSPLIPFSPPIASFSPSLVLSLHLSQSPTPSSLRLSLTNVSLYGYSPLLSENDIKNNEGNETQIVTHLHGEPGQCLCVSFLLFVEPLSRCCPNFPASLSCNLSIFPSFLLGLFLLCVIADHVTASHLHTVVA